MGNNSVFCGSQWVMLQFKPICSPHSHYRSPTSMFDHDWFIEHVIPANNDSFLETSILFIAATICTSGRTLEDFRSQGTGTNLYFQNGTNPDQDYVLIPRRQQDIRGTRWVEGRCFPTMGKTLLTSQVNFTTLFLYCFYYCMLFFIVFHHIEHIGNYIIFNSQFGL